jgi:hypothetical protein
MRTCAAFLIPNIEVSELLTDDKWQAIRDACDLLIEASNELEQLFSTGALRIPADLGEPMEIIPALPASTPPPPPQNLTQGTWVDPGATLPTTGVRNARACPSCDSRANKKVSRVNNKLMLVCPVCTTTWEWKAS